MLFKRKLLYMFMALALTAGTGTSSGIDEKLILSKLSHSEVLEHLQDSLDELEQEKDSRAKKDYNDAKRNLQRQIRDEKSRMTTATAKVKELLRRVAAGEGIDVQDKEGCTLIMRAADCGNDEVVSLILKDSPAPDLSILDRLGRTAVAHERDGGGSVIIQHLSEQWEDAVANADEKLAENLMASGVSPNQLVRGNPPIGLFIKSGNAAILRSGKEAHESAAAITKALQTGLRAAGLPEDAVLLVEDTSRESANELMRGVGYIDLLIPRGGRGLIRACVENATVPCIETGTGICHIYVDGAADFDKALSIVENAKTSRPSVCNAAEVCLIDEKIVDTFLPLLEERLTAHEPPVELRMDERCLALSKRGVPALETDFDTEFLDYKMAVAAVSGVRAATEHIARHSTGHSEAIVTEDGEAAAYFTAAVDSAAVYVNASTRFTDGGEFGLGCEMGISTQKLHARGPMGLRELTTYKYVVVGNGHIR